MTELIKSEKDDMIMSTFYLLHCIHMLPIPHTAPPKVHKNPRPLVNVKLVYKLAPQNGEEWMLLPDLPYAQAPSEETAGEASPCHPRPELGQVCRDQLGGGRPQVLRGAKRPNQIFPLLSDRI